MLKSILSFVLAILICCPLPAAMAEENGSGEWEWITVGVPTQMSGFFFSNMWSNNSVDVNICAMLHGYDTVYMNTDGQYVTDTTVVEKWEATDNEQGRTYTLTLTPGLTYNDGTPISAADYVFSILLHSSPAIVELGGVNAQYSHLTGHGAYASGSDAVFNGVRLLSELSFSLTVSANALPYYYELAHVSVKPYPISVIAPGYAVADNGNGSFFFEKQNASPIPMPAQLSTALLKCTLTAEDGYLHKPTTTSGPYQLLEYDNELSTITLEANPAYIGNHEGQKPSIQKVRVIQLLDQDVAQAYQNGEVQIINQLTDGEAIGAMLALEKKSQAQLTDYYRSGYAFLAFACEQRPTSDVLVRRAVSMCIDRETLCATVLGGYAQPVFGYYGYGQWMVKESAEQLSAFEDVGYNVREARKQLDKAGYCFDSNGNSYNSLLDNVRYKKENGELVPLELRWAKTPGTVSDQLEEMLTPIFESLGIRLVVKEMSFAEMLAQYYRRENDVRTFNIFFLGTNFHEPFDPYRVYQPEEMKQGSFNTSGLQSRELMEAALEMRNVAVGDRQSFVRHWLAFQQVWHDELPTAPIYSNLYYDVCVPGIENYDPTEHMGFGEALLYASTR